MRITRRILISGSAVAALGGFAGIPASTDERPLSAKIRVGRVALNALPLKTLVNLQRLGRDSRSRSSQWLLGCVSDDYRSGRTVVLKGVLLSRTEIARAIDAALSV